MLEQPVHHHDLPVTRVAVIFFHQPKGDAPLVLVQPMATRYGLPEIALLPGERVEDAIMRLCGTLGMLGSNRPTPVDARYETPIWDVMEPRPVATGTTTFSAVNCDELHLPANPWQWMSAMLAITQLHHGAQAEGVLVWLMTSGRS